MDNNIKGKICLSEVEKAFKAEIEHASYIRALTDDFSFLDKLTDIYGGKSNE